MSERITAANLDEVIKRNEVIEEQMKQSASLIWSKLQSDADKFSDTVGVTDFKAVWFDTASD